MQANIRREADFFETRICAHAEMTLCEEGYLIFELSGAVSSLKFKLGRSKKNVPL